MTATALVKGMHYRWRLNLVWILPLACLCFAIQLTGIYYDVTRHSIQAATGIKVDSRLAILELGAGGSAAGFRVGDQVLRVDGREVSTVLEYRYALNQHQANALATLEVQRDTEVVSLPVFVTRHPLDSRFAVSHFVAASFMAIGVVVALRRTWDKTALLFFLAMLLLGLYFALLNKEAIGLVSIQIFAQALIPPVAIHFFLTFPTQRRIAASPWIFLLYIPALAFMIVSMQAFSESVAAGNGVWFSPRFALLNDTVGFSLMIASGVLGIIIVGHGYLTTPHSIRKRQFLWLLWGLGCAIAVAVADLILLRSGTMTRAAGTVLLLGTALLPVAISFAILRYRLLDVKLVLNRSIVYGLVTATMAALYLLFISIPSNALGIVTGGKSFALIVFVSALLIGLLVNPLRARLQAIIDQIFFRKQVDYQRALFRWSEELSTSIRFSDLAYLLLKEIPGQLMLERAWLLVLDETETRFAPLATPEKAENDPEGALPALPANSPAASELVQPGEYRLLEGSQGEEHLPAAGEIPDAWAQAGVQVILPLVSGQKLVGLYLLGVKRSGESFERQDLDTLRTLSNQAAIAIANARLYERVHASSQELEEKVMERTRELGEFVSVVYHELRTPITAIQGYTALLLDSKTGNLNRKQQRYLGTVQHSVQRLTNLVDDLSDMSQLENERLTLQPEPLDIQQVVAETLVPLTGIIEDKGLEVEQALDRIGSPVLGDPQRVTQILTNLVRNACLYTPAGGTVRIAARELEGEIEVTVQDNGIGIRQDEISRIFDRFYRSDDPLVRDQVGTGLGLAITRSLVELHGGRLWVSSKPGKGSTFGFTLRLAETQNEG